MFELSVTIDKASENKVRLRLASITKEMRPVLRQGVNASAIYVASSIKRDYLSGDPVHVRTGNLRRAVFSRMADDLTGVVGVGREAPYGPAVNYGSRPHVITAVRAKALRLVIGGQVMFCRSVMHPGTQPTMFVEKALKAAVPKIREIMEARLAKFVKRHSGE
jgi:hypothetical protein